MTWIKLLRGGFHYKNIDQLSIERIWYTTESFLQKYKIGSIRGRQKPTQLITYRDKI